MIFSTKPNRNETLSGGIYLAFMLIVLPILLRLFNSLTGNTLSAGKVNFLYYFINFAAILPIFRKFLLQSLKDALKIPFPTIWLALLGYMGNMALSELLTVLLLVLMLCFEAYLRRTHSPQQPQHTDPVEETVSATEETAAETVEETIPETEEVFNPGGMLIAPNPNAPTDGDTEPTEEVLTQEFGSFGGKIGLVIVAVILCILALGAIIFRPRKKGKYSRRRKKKNSRRR